MRRITLAVVSTLAVLVLLFSYKTSRAPVVATAQSTAPARIVAGAPLAAGAPPSSSGRTTAKAPAVPGGGVPPAVAPSQVTVPTRPETSPGPTAASQTTASQTTAPPTTAPPTTAPPTAGPPTAGPPTAASTGASPTAAPTGLAPAGPTSTAPAAAPVVVDGAAVDTDYGPVQVRVTINGGRITDVSTPIYPQESGRDQRINSAAIPQLQSEVLAAQGSRIDGVSGATYTTAGFVSSLQSALDAAHFAS